MPSKLPESGARRAAPRIRVTRDGHYLVTGGIPLLELTIGIDSAGDSVDWRAGKQYPLQMSYALCRCGRSGNKPFCDGSHMGR